MLRRAKQIFATEPDITKSFFSNYVCLSSYKMNLVAKTVFLYSIDFLEMDKILLFNEQFNKACRKLVLQICVTFAG